MSQSDAKSIAAATKRLSLAVREQLQKRALAEGWSPSQADAIWALALGPILQKVADGHPAVETMNAEYPKATKQLVTGYYKNAIVEGKNVYTAFLTVIDLARQLAEKTGSSALPYTDDELMAACAAAMQASQRNASAEEQIGAGMAVLNRKAA